MARKYTLAQRLRDPKKRSLLPTSMLTGSQQHERARLAAIRADDRNPLYDPQASLGGHDLKRAATQIVSSIYGPQESALDRQAASTQTQGAEIARRAAMYTDSADDRAAQSQAREKALTDRLNQALAAVASGAQGSIAQAGTDAQARIGADAALRGPGLGGGGDEQVAGELAAARARVASDAQTFGSAGAEQGANYEGLLASTRAAALLHGSETQRQLANRLSNDLGDIRAKRADLGAQRGDEFAKQLTSLRQQEIENRAVAKEFGLKSISAAASVASARSQNAIARAREREAERNNAANRRIADQRLGETGRHNKVSESQGQQRIDKPPAAGKPTPEPAEARKLRVGVVNATEDFKTLLSQPDHKGRQRSADRVSEILRKRGAPPIVIKAASELGQYGYIRPETATALTQAGVRIPKGWRRPKGASTYKSPSQPG